MAHEQHSDKTSYKPLIIILAFCILIPLVTVYSSDPQTLMYFFMGYFFLFLSMFKFFDLPGFVKGFATYDLITKRYSLYGYLYPFIEFSLGLSYLAGWHLVVLNSITVVLMAISGAGVLQSVLAGRKIKCACLGTMLNVPLSTVSILENFGMGSMAAYSLIAMHF